MRLIVIGLALLLYPTWLAAQPCNTTLSGVLPFDPYKPSDLSIVRSYGGAAMSQAPLGVLLKLDPYVPIQGELLRQVGGGIPFWPFWPYLQYPWIAPPTPCETTVPQAPPEMAASHFTTLSDVLVALDQRGPAAMRTTSAAAPEATRGVSIQFDGRVWVSAGPAVPFSESRFVRVGERAGLPIFRPTDEKDDVIYIGTTAGMVAPFRAVP